MLAAAWAVALAVAAATAPPAGAARSAPQSPAPQPAATGVGPDRPFADLFRNLWTDLKALPSVPSAIVAASGGLGTIAVQGADERLSDWANRAGDSRYTRIGRVAGEGWVQAGVAAGVYGIGRMTRNDRMAHVGGDLIRAQLVGGVITHALKFGVSRERPNGGRHAFPSGHTSASFVTAAVIQGHLGWKAGLPAYAAAGFVGWTRIRDREHWLTDVALGATIGVVAGLSITVRHGGRAWTVVPATAPGGAALLVTRRASQPR